MEHRPVNLLRPQTDTVLPQPRYRKRTALYFFIIIIFLITLRLGIKKFFPVRWPTQANAYNEITLQPKKLGFIDSVKKFILHSNNLLVGETDGRINILLLGMGGPGHDGPYLTDTNIIMSIKPDTKEVAMISVPRDLGVNLSGYGWRKINFVNSLGEEKNHGQGGDFARETFSNIFNISIPYYIRVDFAAFSEIINAVGGVTVDVPRGFTDVSFPGPNNSYQTITFASGTQIMDGERALIYARSRHGNNGEGSDFNRAHRQQLILLALKEKLLNAGTYLNPTVIQKIFTSLTNHITTNLDFGQIMYLINIAKTVPNITKNVVLDNSPNGLLVSSTGESGAFLLMPKTGSFDDINNVIANVFTSLPNNPTSTTILPKLSQATSSLVIPRYSGTPIEIQNGTWRGGLAGRFKKRLEDKEFLVLTATNSIIRPISTTTIYIISPNVSSSILARLTNELHAPSTSILPTWLQEEYDNPATTENERGMKYNNQAAIIIILGTDTKE